MVVLNYWRFNGDGFPICCPAMDVIAVSAGLEEMFSVVADMDDSDRQMLSMDHKCQQQSIKA